MVANQTHLTIGAIMLVKHALAHDASTGLWVLSAFYVLGAVLFTALMLGRGLPSVR